MRSGTRLVVAVACGVVVIVASTAAVAAWTFYGPGAVSVKVVPKTSDGVHVSLRVPSFVVRGAVALIPVGAIHLDRSEPALRMALPIAARSLEALSEIPDAVLVEVDDGSDHVRIAKEDSRLVVHVDSDDATVDVSVPLVVVRSVAEVLARSAPDGG